MRTDYKNVIDPYIAAEKKAWHDGFIAGALCGLGFLAATFMLVDVVQALGRIL